MSIAFPQSRSIAAVERSARTSTKPGSLCISQEMLTLLVTVFFSLSANRTFFSKVAETGALEGVEGKLLVVALFLAITALHWLLLLLLSSRFTIKPITVALLLTTALAGDFMSRYTVYLDPDMVRSILHTDLKEGGELVSFGLLPSLLIFGVLPSIFVWRASIRRRPWIRAIGIRVCAVAAAITIATGTIVLAYQPLASLMRNHPELRYLIAPGNYLVSLAKVIKGKRAAGPRMPVGLDAFSTPRPPASKPRLLVIVVGETVRADNWGLNGYARQTTPKLSARRDLINFPHTTACGTATEVSLPCMFSPWGRHAFDPVKVKHSQSLLHVLEHAGIPTLWLDNQTGCKDVCDGLAFESYEHAHVPGHCNDEGCLDSVLLKGLSDAVVKQSRDQVVILHQLGNHGPAYFKRYPPQYELYVPACKSIDLDRCTRQEILNAYDNAILYTDSLLAELINTLAAMPDRDTALIYLSDHGESLGEGGLYLHGLPYAIAPDTQKHVPMLAWLSSGFAHSHDVDRDCLVRRAQLPASHDNLFHSVLGLMGVQTKDRLPELDLFAACLLPTADLAKRATTPASGS